MHRIDREKIEMSNLKKNESNQPKEKKKEKEKKSTIDLGKKQDQDVDLKGNKSQAKNFIFLN
jgi:hypothetical protein